MGPGHVENVADLACRTRAGRTAASATSHSRSTSRYSRWTRTTASPSATCPGTPPARALRAAAAQSRRRRMLERAAELLRGKTKVAILAGAGARGAGDELEELAEMLGAAIVKALLGKDCVPDDSPYVHRRHRRGRHASVAGGLRAAATRSSSSARSFPYIEFLPQPGQAGLRADRRPARADRPAPSRRRRPRGRRPGDAAAADPAARAQR